MPARAIRSSVIAALAAAALLVLPAAAQAAFPGKNGKIAYSYQGDIWTINPDGTGATQLTNSATTEGRPAWSPDGRQIAFTSLQNPNSNEVPEIRVMNADGTNLRTLRTGTSPAWSPDGTRIAFGGLATMAADGTDVKNVPVDLGEDCWTERVTGPHAWSPDGTRVTSSGDMHCFDTQYGFVNLITPVAGGPTDAWGDGQLRFTYEDWSPDSRWVLVGSISQFLGLSYFEDGDMDHGEYVELTPGGARNGYGDNAAWSPDGTTIVFRREPYSSSPGPPQMYLINADGSNLRPLGGPHVGENPDWQPIPINAYPRPKSARPIQVTLVPAYEPCTAPNRVHGPPLAHDSCSPPRQSSTQLTVGTPDANRQGANSTSGLLIDPVPGNLSTPADEADIRLIGQIKDVRVASDLADYTGALEARVSLRITDKDNSPHPGGPGAATVTDTTYSFPFPCAVTAATAIGGECDVDTTADALVPGTAKEGRRAVWQLGQVQVHDGAGNVFMRQGIFIP